MKIRLKDISVSQLNNDSLRLVMKFLRVLKSRKGVILKLQDQNVLKRISDYAKSSNDDELNEIYKELKLSVRQSMYELMKKEKDNKL